MYQLTLQDVTYQDYPIQYPSSPSTVVEEIDIMSVLENQISIWMRKPPIKFYRSLFSLLEIDWSSVLPHFEVKSETSLIKEVLEKTTVIEEMLEFDIVVRMPPIKELSARLRVKSVEKATPRIVEPEEF